MVWTRTWPQTRRRLAGRAKALDPEVTVTVKALTFATRDLPLESWDSGRSLTRMSDRRNGSQIEVCWAAGRRCRATARLVTGPGAAAVTELPDTSRGRGELAQAEPHSG